MPSTSPQTPFELIDRTKAINIIPNNYGRIQKQQIFNPVSLSTTVVGIRENNGTISLIPDKLRGSEPTLNDRGSRTERYFKPYHFPLSDRIYGQDTQNSVSWYTLQQLDTHTQTIARVLETMRNKHAITKEYFSMGALKGVIGYPNGINIDLFNEFGITKKVINFNFSDDTLNVRKICLDIVRHIEDNLLGETMNDVVGWCSSSFFDALTSHPNVKEVFLNHREAVERLAKDVRSSFHFGGVTWSEYRARATDKDGTTHQFIDDNKAHAFPLGTMNTFDIYYCPPVINSIYFANTAGLEIYAFQIKDLKGRWTDIETESNILPICKRPALLVEITMS